MTCPHPPPLSLPSLRFDAIMADIEGGMFGDKEYFKPLVDSISNMKVGNDWFLVANDFASYLEAQKEVDEVSPPLTPPPPRAREAWGSLFGSVLSSKTAGAVGVSWGCSVVLD